MEVVICIEDEMSLIAGPEHRQRPLEVVERFVNVSVGERRVVSEAGHPLLEEVCNNCVITDKGARDNVFVHHHVDQHRVVDVKAVEKRAGGAFVDCLEEGRGGATGTKDSWRSKRIAR